jgi:hypothetical protein
MRTANGNKGLSPAESTSRSLINDLKHRPPGIEMLLEMVNTQIGQITTLMQESEGIQHPPMTRRSVNDNKGKAGWV